MYNQILTFLDLSLCLGILCWCPGSKLVDRFTHYTVQTCCYLYSDLNKISLAADQHKYYIKN